MESSRRDFLKATASASALAVTHRAFAATPLLADSLPTSPAPAPGYASAGFTRGIGVYPGAPSENFSPVLTLDPAAPYRNLALLRPAFHSSSYDYNLTAQLVTDGIKDTALPSWIACIANGGILPREEREILVDHFQSSVLELQDPNPTIEFQLLGSVPPQVDRLALFVVVPDYVPTARLAFTVSTSNDGYTWQRAGSVTGGHPLATENYPPDLARGAHLLAPSIPLSTASESRYYRINLGIATDATSEAHPAYNVQWRLGQVEFHNGPQRVEVGGPYSFTSAWKSAGLDEEWVYVDLGASFSFDRVALHWIARAAEGKLQVSDDAISWRDLQPLPANTGVVDDLRLPAAARGRYVRILMTRPATPHGYILSELEVYGRGGFLAQSKSAPAPLPDGRLILAGGNWKLQRASTETPAGETLSTPGFHDADWLLATVPGTALTSYFNLGAIPDPNFGQNQLHISDSYFYSDFWYRTEFETPTAPTATPGQVDWLNFDGINWKADIFLNGNKLGRIDGGFMRGRFNVTGKLLRGRPNALAIRILRNATPGSCKQKTFATTGRNGGALGADNPTYHASIGWDWIPTIRGRNTGIWSDVYLDQTGVVTLEDPLVSSALPLPSTSHADVTLEVFAVNHSDQPVSGTLHGRFGSIDFAQPVHLAASARQAVQLSPATHKQLRVINPELWWPAGYGDPHLYPVQLRFDNDTGQILHTTSFQAGIRQMTANEDGGDLRLFINGRRFIARGGNWGFGESMLRYRAREYDAAVRYHREMNFTMIRDWVGQIGDDAFYEACDRHGVVVWQDFWLANPWDGPVPADDAMFLANARDYIARIRRHASIGLYCGRNEWFPPATLQAGLEQLLAELHPGIHYIGSSADGPVSGHGPYHAMEPAFYFHTADTKLHSELGSPAIPPLDSVRLMMPASALWPQGLDWGLHDFTLQGAQGGSAFLSMIEDIYGGATSAEEWIALAQFLTYDTYRAMLEAQSQHRMGLLLWMSHPCWPSFVWQTYDYFFEPTAAYFGCKKGSEPLHIQWNSFADTIEVVNYSAGAADNLLAQVELLNMDGRLVHKQTSALSSTEDSTATPIRMQYPGGLSPVHFLRLTLSRNGSPLSTNFYLRGLERDNLRAIRTLPPALVRANSTAQRQGSRWLLTTQLQNTSAFPALLVRAKAIRARSGDRILPAIYSDNYISLMPGEARTLHTELNHSDTRGEDPKIVLEGFNLQPSA